MHCYASKTEIQDREKDRDYTGLFEMTVGVSEATRRGGVSKKTMRQRVCNYEADGAEAFLPHKNRMYSPDLKQQAVEEYLSGKKIQLEKCKKYHIRKQTQLRKWI